MPLIFSENPPGWSLFLGTYFFWPQRPDEASKQLGKVVFSVVTEVTAEVGEVAMHAVAFYVRVPS